MTGLPTDSSHLSSLPSAEHIEEFTGMVDKQFAKASIMRGYANVRTVRNTDTLINRRLGRTTLKKVTAGVRPDATSTKHGRVSVTVDTIILARDNQDLLNDFQEDINTRMELSEDQGKELGKFFDEAFIIQAIKGSLQSAPASLNGAIGAGKNVELAADNDEKDADKLEDAIAGLLVEMQEEDIDTNDVVIFVRPTELRTLSKHDKLIDADYSSENGDFADMKVKMLGGSRIVSTARIPTSAITGHKLSNGSNGSAYDVSDAESDAVAVLIHPRSLLAGETIPLTTKIHYSDVELQYFIDSYIAFGVTVNRPDVCGAVFKYRA
jgi:hypothetical protein